MFGGRWSRFLPGILAVLVLMVGPSCQKGGPAPPDEKGAFFHLGKQMKQFVFLVDLQGSKMTVAPEHGYLWTGAGADDVREVWWVFDFDFDHAEISFKDQVNPQPVSTIKDCKAPRGKVSACEWKIKSGSLAKGVYQFTITVFDASNQVLYKIDPDIEVDK